MQTFRVIVFTSPDEIDDEAAKIAELLDCGADYVHIRKPEWSEQKVRHLIETIPDRLWHCLKLHDHFTLDAEYGLGGVHTNRRNPIAPATALQVSASCHTLDEVLNQPPGLSYITLSPIFDSISKTGYRSGFVLDELPEQIRNYNVIALGGVTPDHFLMLRQKHFSGVALLGYIWNGDFSRAVSKLVEACEMLQSQPIE